MRASVPRRSLASEGAGSGRPRVKRRARRQTALPPATRCLVVVKRKTVHELPPYDFESYAREERLQLVLVFFRRHCSLRQGLLRASSFPTFDCGGAI